jgi:hypothetical protein
MNSVNSYKWDRFDELLSNTKFGFLVLVVENWQGRCANVVLPD